MSDNRVAGFGKDPLAPSHGESLADQSFQSLKSKEIRDSMSPTEMKFHSMTLNNPNTTGWNVQSSSEVSPDGRGFRAETVATTDGVENINGGTAEFKGRNEQRSSAMHEGDDNNFVKKASESSNTHLQEKVVVGDENSGRTEVRTSSSTSTSSSQVFQSSSTTDHDNGQPVQYLMDSNRAPQRMQEPHHRQTAPQYEPQVAHDVRQSTDQSSTRQHYDHQSEQYRQNRHESNTSQNVQTNETHEQNKRYVDMDKASPEYQRHVQHLMSQPGEVISNTVEYPKPNVKMITTVKRLPDGTIVRNKRYETEETNPSSVPSHASNTRQTTSNQTNQRREPQTNQQTKNYREPSDRAPSERYRQPDDDHVDNVETKHYTHNTHSDNVSNVETKYSTVKTSNRKFSTETTSEHVQEYDDHHGPTSPGSRAKPVTNSFSTHGFPSVRPNKPTQEFATDRPNLGHPSQNFTAPRDALIPVHGEPNQNTTERRIPTNDGEVIIVSSEKRRNVKQQTNSERIVETDIRQTDDNRYQNVSDVTTTKTSQDFSTHGFPSVSEPFSQQKVYPDNRQVRPVGPGYSPQTNQGAPATYVPEPNSDNVVISSQKSHTSKHSTNTERIIETEIVDDDGRNRSPAANLKVTMPGNQGQPRSPAGNYTVTTLGSHYSPNTPNQDFSTHGFPSVKSPTEPTPNYSSQGYPSARSPTRATPGYASPREVNKPRGVSERPLTSPVKTSPSTKKSSTTIETTERVIQKEKEVDAAHRAFAASLRSSSPADSPRRDSYSTDGPRHTPRSSVSSTKTFRRDMREGSHDSDTSRVSASTITRQTPPKTVGGRTVITKQTVVTTKNGPGANEILTTTSPRGSKSPSPGKSVTTTTTTRTITSKALPRDVPKAEESPRSSPAPSSRSSPYPSKSKSPLGEDDQSIKSYTSRPLSPSSSTRSPKPIGSKDVPNSRGQRPTNVVSDERRTVDRDTVAVETSTVVDDYLEDDDVDVNFNSMPNMKNTTKQLITHEADLVPKRSPLKITNSPQQTPNSRRENLKRVDRSEEPKRPKPNDQTTQRQPPTRPKSETTTSTTLIINERKVHTPQKVAPKNVGPTKTVEGPRKPQPKPSENITSSPKDTQPKFYDDENEDQYVPKGGFPDLVNFSETDDEPTTSNVREISEIIVQRTNKKPYDEFEYDDISEIGEIPSRNKPQPNKFQPIRKETKPNRGTGDKTPNVQAKITSTALITNERKAQKTQNVATKNVSPTRRTESPSKPQTEPLSRPLNPERPKYPDDGDEYVPKSSHPDHVHFSETDDETITSNVRETRENIVKINELDYDNISETGEITNRNKSEPKQFQPIRNENKPNSGFDGRRKVQATKVFPKNPKMPEDNPTDKGKHIPKDRSPHRVNLSETEDEFVGNNYRETSEITVQTTNKSSPIQKERVTLDNDYPHAIPKDSKQEPKNYKLNPTKPSNDLYTEEYTHTVTATHLDEGPKRPLGTNSPLESEDEPISPTVLETSAITIETTNKKLHSSDKKYKVEPKVTPRDTVQRPMEYDVDVEVGSYDKEPHSSTPRTNKPDIFKTTVTTHAQDEVQIKKTTKDIHEQFIDAERSTHPELPDGLYLSKTTEPAEPTSPTFKKKGTSRRDTFEDRCRQILGMESYGDTPGSFKTSPIAESPQTILKTVQTLKQDVEKSVFDVKIEDCGDDDDDDDEPITITSVKKTILEKKTAPSDTEIYDSENPNKNKLLSADKIVDKSFVKTTEEVYIASSKANVPETVTSDSEPETNKRAGKSDVVISKKPETRYPTKSLSPTRDIEPLDYETVQITTTRVENSDNDVLNKTTSRSPIRDTKPTKKPESRYPTKASSPTKDIESLDSKTVRITTKQLEYSDEDVSNKTTSRSPSRSPAPIRDTKYKMKPEPRYPTKSVSPTRDTESSDFETVRITTKRVENSDEDVSNKTTSRSPSRSPAPIRSTKPKTKPETRYPTKSVSPKRNTESTDFETVRITTKRVENLDEDVSNKTTLRSPSKSPAPIRGTKPLKNPETGYPTKSVSPTRDTESSDVETVRIATKRVENSDVHVSNKATSRSPLRSPSPIKDRKPTTNAETRYPTKSVSPIRNIESSEFETVRITTKRVENSDEDVSNNTRSRSPSRSPAPIRGTKPTKKPETRYPTKSVPRTKDTESSDFETVQITTKRVKNLEVDASNKATSRTPLRSASPIKDTKPLKKPSSKSPSDTEPLNFVTTRVTSQRIESSDIDVSKRPTTRSPAKSLTPSNDTKPSKAHPLDVKVSMQISPKSHSPTKDSTKRKPDSPSKTTTSQYVRDENIAETTTIKDRLRSSTRKERTPKKPDQVDAGSSPETSPSRYTGRRRSSNISVNTEIIIEHADTETVGKTTESKIKKQTDSVYKEIVNSTRLPEKMPKKIPVTERKESAPVHRVTRKDKDSKMSRSTSENIIKVKKPEPSSNLLPQSPKMSAKTPDHRRPNKCFATKTINLSTTDRLLTSEDMQNVVIDIQQAKSSREPSPDKIVPTPVPAHLDTGKPRYPDVVQEPEDEPRRKPVIKNIPIFEEEHNNYVGCHITEVNIDKSRKTIDCSDYRDDEILNTPVVEAPLSLDYPQPTEVTDDECLLSVHDKVSKFQHIAKEITKPKTSGPFNREFDDITRVPDNDECLLSVDEKVDKFIKTAQNLTKEAIVPERDTRRPLIEVTDQDLDTTECTYAPVKLGPSAPQRSPELVRHISRNISRQSDISEPSVEQDDYQHTYESHEKETVSKRSAQELVTHHKHTSAVRPQPVTADYNDDDDDGEELIPHTAQHTTILEERRQKNILARPSVFDNDKNKTPIRKAQPKYVSPVKDSEKSTTINKAEVKSRAKPETPKHSTVHEKTTTTSTTSRRKQQSPQRPNPETDCDYRRSSVETGVSSNTTKQTKLYSTSGPKRSPQPVNKKPGRESPLRTNITKNVKQERDDVDDHDDDDAEFEVVPNDRETEVIINTGTATRSTTTKTTGKISVRKEPTHATNTTTSLAPKKMKENPISSTCSSPSRNTKAHLVDITERSTQKHNTTTTTNTIDINKSPETNKSFLEKPTSKKPPHPPQPHHKAKITTTDSVAARRSLFENNGTTNTRPKPSATSSPGRRPSYMDHTKSSLEHIRRDSLELSKSNYTRKPSEECEDDIHQIDRDTQVKFDVPQRVQKSTDSETEDVDVEEIYDLEILEKMLEIVTSYELRRRIRAQIRLVKKNHSNVQHKESETTTTTKVSNLRDRSVSPVTSVRESGSKVTTKKQYYYREEERTSSSTHTSPERTQRITTTKVTRTHSPESKKSPIFSDRGRSPQHKPAQVRGVCSREHERSQSPDSTATINRVVTSRKEYEYRNEHGEQVERTDNIRDPSPRKSPLSPYHSPERHDVDNSKSPPGKTTHVRVTSRSPDNKVSSTMKSNSRYEQSVLVKQQKHTPVVNVTKGKPEQKAPVWADRKNVLKTPASTTPKKTSSVTDSRPSGVNKTVKSTTNHSQKHITNKSTYVEDDCITSSYGIGPTDENGLPLFGIRALKKKKNPTSDPCETTEEVTGYVVEEKYYSDNKSKPLVERKEIIYSTNPMQLDAIKDKVKETTTRKTHRGEHAEKSQPLVTTTTTVRSSPEDSYLESSTKKYVRRGSVKEMSEKFIHKESSSSVSEKSNNYPKAGLILRTNSRRHSRDNDAMEGDNIDSYETRDSEEDNSEGFVRVEDSTHSSRILADSESECESVQTQREFKKITSSTSSSTRSFLNSKGEEQIITNVSDVLDRMRNADNVVEDGDTAEDQEARALLNKFLGASIIMKGVESTIPLNRETKLTTTTSTSSGKQPMKHEVKTTRVTKTIKSGSSSSPVTETTCDIEEIWDEEILKQLLEQARTYEERRKIRSRLRELMADRPEQQKSSTSTTEKTETKEQDGAVVTTTTKVTTRTVAGGTGTKTVSPFAKFKQLDRQNSQQSAKMSK